MISAATTRRIRDAVDIASVIRPYVRLRKSGATLTGLCPFHKDSNASFSVSREKGLFHCFSCHAAGDAFSFLQRIEGISFPEALKRLSEQTGISLESTPVVTNKPKRRRAVDESDDAYWYWLRGRLRLTALESRARWLDRQAWTRFTPETCPETAWLVFAILDTAHTGIVDSNRRTLALLDDAGEGPPLHLLNAYLSLPQHVRRAVHRARLDDEASVSATMDAIDAIFAARAVLEDAA